MRGSAKLWWALAPLAALLIAASAFIGWTMDQQRAPRPDDLLGRQIPETVLPMLTGDEAGPGMLDLKTAGVGRPMLVNVFASWCGPCRTEHPRLMALKARGVAVVGVALRDEPEATRAFLDELGDPYARVLVDADGEAAAAMGVTGAPETLAVDAMGKIVARSDGPLVEAAEIERLVAAMQAPARPLPTARTRPSSEPPRAGR